MTATVGDTATLAHGYTMAQVQKAASWACKRRYTAYLDPEEKWDTAWFGILELLYSSEEPPHPHALQFAAEHAISEAARKVRQGKGHNQNRSEPGPNFIKYWRFMEEPHDNFTDRIVERLALPQVLALLTDIEYEALAALAIYGDQTKAADSLGIERTIYYQRLKRARKRAIAAWYDHETPRSQRWNDDAYCRHGHPRSEHSYYDKRGLRMCRVCRNIQQQRRRARER